MADGRDVEQEIEELLREMRAVVGNSLEFVVRRDRVEPGRSFSADAMADLTRDIGLWIGSRVMLAWEERNEPPTLLRVRVEVEAS